MPLSPVSLPLLVDQCRSLHPQRSPCWQGRCNEPVVRAANPTQFKPEQQFEVPRRARYPVSEPAPFPLKEAFMPELPRGTVTFLFTDIEGSTALWERDRHSKIG